MIDRLFAEGLIADIVLAVLIASFIGLVCYRQITGRGPAFADLIWTAISGLCLTLALRVALTGAERSLILVALSVSGLAYIMDLRARWPRS
jgi:hypothetical protein